MAEGELDQLPHRVGVPGADHVVAGLGPLQHAPHGLDVVAGESPVAPGVEVAQADLAFQAQLDAGGRAR